MQKTCILVSDSKGVQYVLDIKGSHHKRIKVLLFESRSISKKEMETLHIGTQIRQVLENKKVRPSELERRMGKSRQSVHHMLGKASLDTHVLLSIAYHLEYDFFDLYSDVLRKKRKK